MAYSRSYSLSGLGHPNTRFYTGKYISRNLIKRPLTGSSAGLQQIVSPPYSRETLDGLGLNHSS
jgi:hypothetical protein